MTCVQVIMNRDINVEILTSELLCADASKMYYKHNNNAPRTVVCKITSVDMHKHSCINAEKS